MTTTTLKWNKGNVVPEKDCTVLVLCVWNHGNNLTTVFHTNAKAKKEVKFATYPVVAWAEIDLEKIELGIQNDNFNEDFVNFLHNNIKNI